MVPRPLLLLIVLSTQASSQSMTGYAPANAERQREVEAAAIRRPRASEAATLSRALSKESHVAGTPAQARTRDYVIAQMKKWGFETEVRAYDIWMPHPVAVKAGRVSPSPKEFILSEPPVSSDPTSALAQYLTVNGYSGQGDVTADVVYVNYGLIEDYAKLDSLGVSVRGRIAVARYGRSFRGIKAREAERHGAVGLFIYSDPMDDGFVAGDVYPAGPMRNPNGVQRGSILNSNGDPSTPGYGSTNGAARLTPEQMVIPRIPVVPISYANAADLLRGLGGPSATRPWQGGLSFHYHIGPGPVKARIMVRDDRATKPLKPIFNTFGVIRGTEFPDEMVIIGGHRDAWGPGAADNVSGIVSILEAARSVAEQLATGWKPKRTLVFATWDAEEWGLIGSTEYVEDDSLRLMRNAVAYFNQDVAAQGPRFGGGGSPSLRPMLRDVSKLVPDPAGGTVYSQWRAASAIADSVEPAMGDPGGGSDFAGFYNHLGIPIAEWGFGGPGGVYHSQYDSYAWMSKFGDPGFEYHAAAARVATAMMLRIANADVLPYDYVEYARTMMGYLPAIERSLRDKGWTSSTSALRVAIAQLSREATMFNAARDSALATNVGTATLQRTNQALMQVERALLRPQGLRTRSWFRNLIYVADENNGYANMVFPSVNEAIRAGDATLTGSEIQDLAMRFEAAAKAVASARSALTAR
jgi:N-acetylated-alpha-linked acidic dipeptidase